MQRVSDEQRRARFARRHRLAPGFEATDAVEAATSVLALHATDPATVYLSAWARVPDFDRASLTAALYDDRSLIKHMAMRRTVWVVPRPILPAVQAGASERVATAEHGRLDREVAKAGARDGDGGWLDAGLDAVDALLADGKLRTTTEIRKAVPALGGSTRSGEGKSWGGDVPIAGRLLTVASAQGRIVRAGNDGPWTASRIRWASMASWLGEPLPAIGAAAGTEELVVAWLRAFGPGTEADLKWWLGSTFAAVRAALAAVDAVSVELDDGSTGYLMGDDLEPVDAVGPWGALLPSLDPTAMGWQARDWYLGPHKPHVFDRNGNAGPTAWWDGQIVGGWRLDDDGRVELQLLEDIGRDGVADLEVRAASLTAWLDGTKPAARFPSPLLKR